MSGIEKDVDNLGRVVIPIEFRRKIGIGLNSKVVVSLQDDAVIISPAFRHYALCGERVEAGQQIRLCSGCINKVKSEG